MWNQEAISWYDSKIQIEIRGSVGWRRDVLQICVINSVVHQV